MPIDTSRRRFTQAACAGGLMPWLAGCGGDDDVPEVELEYARAVRELIASHALPGVLAGVRRPGRRPWHGAFGAADLDSGAPLALGSHFPIRSVTKSLKE